MNDTPLPASPSGPIQPPSTPTGFGQRGISGGETVRVEYLPRPGLGSISITNFLLNLVTLWFYRFWAKTRVRRHIWSNVHINGEPLEYTGTGKELFLGFLVIMGIVFLPLALIATVLAIYYGPESVALTMFQIVISFALVTLYGFAIYRARRYRLSRTVWRGIRGALTGSALSYSGKYFAALLLSPMTAGWSRPAMNLLLAEQMYNDMRFGNQPFTFRGRAGPLYAQYAICWFLMAGLIVAIVVGGVGLAASGALEQYADLFEALFKGSGTSNEAKGLMAFVVVMAVIALFLIYQIVSSIIWALYTAREMNLFTQYTTFPGLRFDFSATGWSLVTLWLGNLALIIFTLGIAQPFVEQRIVRYFCDRLSVIGTVDFAAIKQSQAQIDKRGEGLIDALDLDAF